MYILQTLLYCFIFLAYMAIPVFPIYYFATDKIPPNHEEYVRVHNKTEYTNPKLRKIYDNYDNHLLFLILSLIIHLSNFIYNLVVMRIIYWSKNQYNPTKSRVLCFPSCCVRSVYIRPFLGHIIIYIICLGCTLASLILLKNSKITFKINEEIDTEYNNTIDGLCHSTIIQIILISSIIALSLLYIILECTCWKKYRIEGMEVTNWFFFIIQRYQEVQVVQGMNGIQIVQKQALTVVTGVVSQLDSEKNRNINQKNNVQYI